MAMSVPAAAPRILVVDDDAWTLRMVPLILNSVKKRGYTIITASDGDEALNKAVAEIPDLILTDIVMPKMNGWTLIRQVRSLPQLARIPVIFLTALQSSQDRVQGFQLGADDYLPKPFLPEELDLRIAKALQRRAEIEAILAEQARAARLAAPACLQGTLAQVGLSSVLTLLEMERKSGELLLFHPDQQQSGRILLRDGRVVVADLESSASQSGEEAVYQLLGWTKGKFRFDTRSIDCADQIQVSNTQLLLEGSRRLDEARTPA